MGTNGTGGGGTGDSGRAGMGDTGTDGTSREVAAPRVLAGGTGAAEPWQYQAQVGAKLGAAGSPWPPASASFLPPSLSQLLAVPPPTPLGLSSHPPARPHFSGFELILSTPLAAGCQLSIPQPPPHPPPSSACLPLQETPAAAAGRTDGRTPCSPRTRQHPQHRELGHGELRAKGLEPEQQRGASTGTGTAAGTRSRDKPLTGTGTAPSSRPLGSSPAAPCPPRSRGWGTSGNS